MGKRRFVVCYDGTWNTPDKGDNPTNVVKMVRAVRNCDDDGVTQVVFYDKGVGTAGGTDSIAGGGFGVGLTANVVDGYRFLANNCDANDEIYVFGFSRGAYTARSLCGLVSLAGLLTPGDLGGGLRDVMKIYHNKDLKHDQKREEIRKLGLAEEQDVRIRCVGVWDTVGSLGIPTDLGRQFRGGKYYAFHDVELGKSVDVALHAVAVDEKRSAFSPTLWVSKTGEPLDENQKVEQVWFAGCHSNVGGSYFDTTLSDLAFDWMARRVMKLTRLALDYAPDDTLAARAPAGRSIDSRTLFYKDSVLYPYQRVINARIPKGKGFGDWFRRRFPDYDRRNIPPDDLRTVREAIHISLLDRWKLPAVPHDCKDQNDSREVPYRPVNLAAVIEAHHEGQTTPVVGWHGEPLDPAEVAWPKIGP